MQPNVPNTQPGNNDQNKCAGCGLVDPNESIKPNCNIY